MAETNHTYLGRGVYSLNEAAQYIRTHSNRMRAWFLSDTTGRRRVFHSDYPTVRKNHAISFRDMVDALVAVRFREQGVSLKAVRESYAALQEKFGLEHPFCHRNLRTDGRSIFIGLASELEDDKLYEVVSGQAFFRRVMQRYLKQIHYGSDDAAVRWDISDGVTINPEVCFGAPVIEGTRVQTDTLVDSYYANGKDERLVADLYGVQPSDVGRAVEFASRVLHRAA